MATKKVFVAGFGGQGVLLIGQMLAYAAMYEGKEATWMPSYGPEMRGGTANCTVCISDKPIASPLVTTCDVLVAMNGPSLDKFEDMLVPGGHLFVNASVINYKARRTDVNVHYVDCTHTRFWRGEPGHHGQGPGQDHDRQEGRPYPRQQDSSVCLERVRKKNCLETNYAYSRPLWQRQNRVFREPCHQPEEAVR